MYVHTRSGEKEPIKFDKITDRINTLSKDFDKKRVDSTAIAQKVIEGIYDGITTRELDQLAEDLPEELLFQTFTKRQRAVFQRTLKLCMLL